MNVDDILICVSCNGKLIKVNNNVQGNNVFICNSCDDIFPVIDFIHVMLPPEDSSFEIENEYFMKNNEYLKLNNIYDRYEKRLKKIQQYSNKTWEKEDVEFFDSRYDQRNIMKASEVKPLQEISGIRLYRRNKYLFSKIKKIAEQNSISLMEIGCGEGDTILNCYNPYFYKYLYIASDYSYNAMKYLKKVYDGLDNVVLIQCKGSKIPFADEQMDIIVGLGILHHMPQKEKELWNIMPKLKKNGYFMASEVFEKNVKLPSGLKKIYDKWIEPNKSAHEERINIKNFISISKQLGTIEFLRYEHTPLLTILIKYFGKYTRSSVFTTKLFFLLDNIIIYTIGKIIGILKPGALYARVKKSK
jgi:ubiquinone/menaquinone biosynthesis C-methylase UbiE/uncharacterized protein YbaR (Trm112 family)